MKTSLIILMFFCLATASWASDELSTAPFYPSVTNLHFATPQQIEETDAEAAPSTSIKSAHLSTPIPAGTPPAKPTEPKPAPPLHAPAPAHAFKSAPPPASSGAPAAHKSKK
jgi:hypothetical protein